MNKFSKVLESSEFTSTISDILLEYEEKYNLNYYITFDYYIDSDGFVTQEKTIGCSPCFGMDVSTKLSRVENITEFVNITGNVISKLDSHGFKVNDFICDSKKKFGEYVLDSKIWFIDENNKIKFTFLKDILNRVKSILTQRSVKFSENNISLQNDVINILIPKHDPTTMRNIEDGGVIRDILRGLKIGINHKVSETQYTNDEISFKLVDSNGPYMFIQITDVRKNREENYKRGFKINT